MKSVAQLAIMLAVLALPAVGWAQDFIYSFNSDSTVTIAGYTGWPNQPSGALSIPSTITGYPVTSIRNNAFNGCTNLTSVTMPASVTNIGTFAFYLCTSLTNMTVPVSVTSIGGSAFAACTALTAITVDAGNPAYCSLGGILYDKSLATLIAYPAGLAGSYAISNSVKCLGSRSFFYCSSLTSVAIPNSVTNIGVAAFAACTTLTAITVDADNPAYCSLGSVLYDKSHATLIAYPAGLAGSYTIANSVATIGTAAFDGCTNLSNVIMPDSVTSVGVAAFAGCTHLTSMTVSTNITDIGDDAFEFCYVLDNFTFPDSVTNIGAVAFQWCLSLTSITIPARVANIGVYAFIDCPALSSVYFKGNVPNLVGGAQFSATPATIYYLPNTIGWDTFTGPTPVLWNPQATPDATFGILTNRFGFTITNAGSPTIIVDACTNLTDLVWVPVSTNTLTGGTSYFSDPQWTNYTGRFYRFRAL